MLMAIVAGRELNLTPQEELYAKFYNRGKLFVVDMDVTQLREHREELAQIAFEAKATLAAADDELRERKAKSSKKEWMLTPTGPDAVTSDAINAVAIRKARMNKIDRLKEQLEKIGFDEEIVKKMVANLERNATEKNLKTVTFTKQVTKTTAVVVQKVKQENGEVKPVFNPANLSFSNK